jgi:hypothetical protein
MLSTKPQSRDFTLDDNLFFVFVNNQAGTREKAILEACMNSVDAGSPSVNIVIEKDKIQIIDQGKGFISDEEIKNFFSTIGTPHNEGDAHYGRYRMGRCQLMRYGRNTWRSNTFELVVDVKKNGSNHTKTSGLPQQNGCHITIDLYDTITSIEVKTLCATVAEWIEWLPIPAFVNGKPVTRKVTDAKWTIETDDAYILLNDSPEMKVYNRGVFVMNLNADKLGSGGVIVSKIALDVIFARNDIQAKCPVWRRICKTISDTTRERSIRRGLNNETRTFLCQQLIAGELDLTQPDIQELKLFTMVDGGNKSIIDLTEAAREGLAIAPLHDPLGRVVHRAKLLPVLSTCTVDRFQMSSIEELIERLIEIFAKKIRTHQIKSTQQYGRPQYSAGTSQAIAIQAALENIVIADLDTYKNLMRTTYTPVSSGNLPTNMRSYFRCLEHALAGFGWPNKAGELPPVESIKAGSMDGSIGFMSGSSLILDPLTLPDPRDGLSAIINTVSLVLKIITNNTDDDQDIKGATAITDRFGAPTIVERFIEALLKQNAHAANGPFPLRMREDAEAFIAKVRQERKIKAEQHREPATR